MKKFAVILLTILMVTSLAACAGGNNSAEGHSSEDISGAGTESEPANDAEENESAENESEENESAGETEGLETLVVYFSATNTTEGVAEQIADCLSADIYEIVPEQLYTDVDLNYHDDNSRSSIEMNDPASRPAISGSVENMEQYSIVFIG